MKINDHIHAERRFFKAALETVGAIVVILDLDGRIVFVNRGCADVMLLPEEEITGKNFWNFVLNGEKKTVAQTFKRVVASEQKARMEMSWVSKYGTSRLFDCALEDIRGDNGDVKNVILTGIDVTERKRAEEQLRKDAQKFREMFIGAIQAVSMVVEKRDLYTAGHQVRVAELAAAIAKEMRLPVDRIEGVYLGGLIHDIGKVSIPAEILTRPSKLTEIEFGMIMGHPKVGYDIIHDLNLPWPVKDMILQHHERLDGLGYPSHIKGNEIVLEARIIAVSDVVEAMSSHRPYRAALGVKAALDEIQRGKGVLYDKEVANACLMLFDLDKFEWRKDPMSQ